MSQREQEGEYFHNPVTQSGQCLSMQCEVIACRGSCDGQLKSGTY